MKKIIVPVDFSEHSEYALEAASMLAKKNNAEILALHMLEI
ncbi:MAG TPA: universal stress protein, partial [Xanthomarina gelatinilytica]|nr:universal stress protein [Xanthomarina gelatinilytica]